jgi:hypothetical protein
VLKVKKEKVGNDLNVWIQGFIDETSDFNQALGVLPPAVNLYTKEVSRINSTGVKAWLQYFRAARDKGTKLKFLECSSAIVEQINLIPDFTCGGTVASICVPYLCAKCGEELHKISTTEEIKKTGFKIPNIKCDGCGGDASFDDIAAEYFRFLNEA